MVEIIYMRDIPETVDVSALDAHLRTRGQHFIGINLSQGVISILLDSPTPAQVVTMTEDAEEWVLTNP